MTSLRCAALAMLVLGASGCGAQRAALFPAPLERRHPLLVGAHLVTLPSLAATGDGVVALHAPAPSGEPTIAYMHGNAEDLARIVPFVTQLRDQGLGVYAIEYPGYGLATGEPTEEAIYAVADAALTHLHGTLGVPPADVVLAGRSLGTGVAVEMAMRGHGSRVLLFSPYTSIDDLAHHFTGLPGTWLVDDHFDSARKAPGLGLPVLIVAGTKDALVPSWMSSELSRRFPDAAVLWVRGGHHNDLFARAGAEIVRNVAVFARLGRARQ